MLLPPPQTMPHPLQAGEEQSGRLLAVAGSPREMKQRLLEDHNNVGCSRRAAMVRPVAAADFAEARSEVTSSVSGDSHAMTELRQWNAKFGEGDRSGYRETTLSYFM